MDNKDKKKDMLKNEDISETLNKGNKVPNIHPVGKIDESDRKTRSSEDEQAGRSVGNEPRSGGRQGGKSVQDGGQDIGSSAGS
jgi:hypothetical protein